jgi:hypothetical protein
VYGLFSLELSASLLFSGLSCVLFCTSPVVGVVGVVFLEDHPPHPPPPQLHPLELPPPDELPPHELDFQSAVKSESDVIATFESLLTGVFQAFHELNVDHDLAGVGKSQYGWS